MLAISFFGTFEKFQSPLGKSLNLLPRCGHSSPGNSKPYRACVCIEVQTLWPSKKQKRFQDTNAKPLRLTTSQISSLRHSWIEENFLPEMPHPSHCTWIAIAIAHSTPPIWWSGKNIIPSSTSRPSMDSWNAWPEGYRSWRTDFNNLASSNHQQFSPTSSIIEMSQKSQDHSSRNESWPSEVYFHVC